jgi:hypothetical protein
MDMEEQTDKNAQLLNCPLIDRNSTLILPHVDHIWYQELRYDAKSVQMAGRKENKV